jgi:predicted RNA binding protein YcfA (HicA-like mRNA interferase family)
VKLPRDIGGEELAQLLKRYGYQVSRQTGSHMRLTAMIEGTEYHLTIPKHNPLKIGTLHGILNDIATQLNIDKKSLLEELFED